ncbi:MAG: putative drug exporter of the superfamily [Mycobacterium sp.]|nr:putative drug exporter of the superfamily [Mycobacterium sp.]
MPEKLRKPFKGASFPALGRLIVRHPVLVIVGWLALAIALFLAIPPLPVVAQLKPPAFLPSDSPVLVSSTEMKQAFKEPSSDNVAVVILSDPTGLTAADVATYTMLVDKLHADKASVVGTQDFLAIPELKQALQSADNKAWQLPVNMVGVMGTGDGQQAYRNVVKIVKDTTANTTLTANVVGPAATMDDLTTTGAEDQHFIEIATVLMVLTILLVVYRNVIAMLLPLATIGVSLVAAQQVVAGLGLYAGLPVGPQTLVLMTGLLMGAGTDYAVFLFSRYHELVRGGRSSDDALVESLASIGGVITASAATVAIAFGGLAFTTLGIFQTIGFSLSITIATGYFAAITMLPALIVLAGRRGWIKPRKDMTGRFWRRSGVHIARRPRIHLAASLVILIALAATVTLANYNYDDRKTLPPDSPSNRGYTAMDAHFPVAGTLQQFLMVTSPNTDLRSPRALADLEQLAHRVSALPGIDLVRGITRPTGNVLEQAKTSYQVGEVGDKLLDGSTQIQAGDSDLNRLSGGAHQMADVLGDIKGKVVGAILPVRSLVSALADMQTKMGGSKSLNDADNSTGLVANMRGLGKTLNDNISKIAGIYAWAEPLVNVLNNNPLCNLDQRCMASRNDLNMVVTAYEDGTLTKLSDLGQKLENSTGAQTLDEVVPGLGKAVDDATSAAKQLGVADPAGLQQQLISAQDGVTQLADASRQLADGVQTLVDRTRDIGSGMDQASAFLLAMKRDGADPPMSGFYIPPEILTQAEFKKAATLFISADGHTARYLVQTALDPFSTAAMDQVQEIVKTAESALPNTSLANAKVSMMGFSVAQRDIRDYYNGDVEWIMIVTLIVVFLILALLLRSLVAPIYLVASVILSYVSAVGIGVVFFQFLLGQQLSWNVPGMAFLVLVAVGADYNLLLISRIREEAVGRGIRSGVIRTVGSTGGVITSAGLIFAASMLGLMASSISNIVQTGFIIGVGLLLDTFVVRTITVPAMAVIVGKANWWPAGRRADKQRKVRWTPMHGQIHAVRAHAAMADAPQHEPAAETGAEEGDTVDDEEQASVNGNDVNGVNGNDSGPLGDICDADACTIVEPVRTLRHYPLVADNCQDNWLPVPADASSSSSRAN